jgi:hypothetical protein
MEHVVFFSFVYKCSCRDLCYTYSMIFKIKHKLYIAPGSAPPPQHKFLGVHLVMTTMNK